VKPGQTLFTVNAVGAVFIGKGACQAGDGGANRIRKQKSSTGCLTAEEVIVIRRPHLFSCIARQNFPGKVTVLIRSWSIGGRASLAGWVVLK